MHSYSFGVFEVRPDERRVLAHGKPQPIGARAFDLLVCLIERRERIVTKNELLELIWTGLVVEENNLTVHVSALRKLLGAETIATIPGRGYRFASEVSEQQAIARPPARDATAELAEQPHVPSPDGGELSLPSQPSVAVLPFDNLSGDPGQDYFVDGITEDIITELSRFRSLFVIARNSTYSYKGKAVDVRTISGELGVRYVVEGSIRRGADRVRVSAQLIDSRTGVHLWAEKFDRPIEDVFSVQADLTRAIVAAIAPQIESSEFQKVRSGRPAQLSAFEMAMRARDAARQADRDAETVSHEDALRVAMAAVDLDPNCGTALGTIAYLRWRQLWAGNTATHAEPLALGLAAARRAIAVDSHDHVAHLWKGMLLMYAGQTDAGLRDLRLAHELNPNDALTLSLLGQYEALEGDAETGVQHVSDALRLSPRDPLRWSFLNSLAWAHFAAGDYRNAAATAEQSIDDAPRFYPPHLCLVMSRVGLGQIASARAGFDLVREIAPEQIDARLEGRWTIPDVVLKQRATMLLRVAAGLDEANRADSPE